MVKHCCWGNCTLDERYPEDLQGAFFIPFPKPTKPENIPKVLRWIKACNRPYEALNVNKITRNTYICSRHFVGGQGPSEAYPDPFEADVYAPQPETPPLKRRRRIDRETANGVSSGQEQEDQTQTETSGQDQGVSMVQCARHAVVEFSPDWDVRMYHCVICDFSCTTSDDFVTHASSHLIKKARTNFYTTASADDGTKLEHTNTFIIHEEVTSEVTMQIKLEPKDEIASEQDQEEAMQTYDGTTEDEEDAERDAKDADEDDGDDDDQEQKPGLTHHVVQRTSTSADVADCPEQQVFLCTQCRMPFSDFVSLQTHIIETHQEGKKGACSICGKFFPKLADLDRHTMLEHTAPGVKAMPMVAQRGNITSQRRVVMEKMEYINDPDAERRYRCKICGSTFKLRHHCSDHIKAIHQQLSYPCEVCNKKYKSKRALKMHLLDHQDQGVVTNVEAYHRCQICKKAFLRRHQFENHVRVRHGTMLFPCHLCSNRFTHEELLHAHLKNHDETYKFKCQICQISFASVKDRQVHTAVHTGDIKVELADVNSSQTDETDGETLPGVPVICSVCGLTFSSDDALKVHCIKDHNDPVVFSCNTCSNEFASFLDLLNHIKQNHRNQSEVITHGGMPVFPTLTGDTDTDRAAANGEPEDEGASNDEEETSFEARIFTKVNDDSTPVPDKFPSSRRSTSRTKKYKCADCGHRFGYLHHLKDHRNSFHTGVLYSCKKCGKQYKRKNSLREHTCEQIFCHICNRPFQYRGHLVKHMQQMHDADPNGQDEDEAMQGDEDDAAVGGAEDTFQLELVQDGDEEEEVKEAADEEQDIKPIILPGFIIE